jgi:F-type H+-transporting ATPase subunit delta
MGKLLTLARPYATAAFEYAHQKNVLPAWEAMLAAAADVVRDPAVTKLLMDPRFTDEQLTKLFYEVLASMLDQEMKNFISLLAEKNRLSLLPDIAELFKASRAALEKIVAVKLTTAVELNEAMKNKMKEALIKRLQQQILLECEVDPSLIGGAIIDAENIVIDGSVRGQLKRLLESLSV